ncbi:MAG: bifunctional glutamate N-acetyltransferase/amino-acid acetyltransferase ArgJ [Deltaproteobacteria bacterium]|nr:bifunctional glutamate N-acetyltransferase/amino-acid acetyltransferase ArgJ [Deltaproteobacteria bacterium]
MPAKKVSAKAPSTGLMVRGFKAAGIACGIKKNGKKDLALILSDTMARVAAVFTENKVKAAPVILDMKRVKKGASRGVIVNSGNANACTGKDGYRVSESMAGFVEKALKLKKGDIMVSSTGVIGVPLPVVKVSAGVAPLIDSLSYDGLHDATEAIMTTDAFPKKAVRKTRIGGRSVTVAGIAKGAGMICPNMATMLAFFVTDANIGSNTLKRALKESVDASFNSIIVDNDTSTNDTAMVFANGLSGGDEIKAGTPGYAAFTRLLTGVATELAHMIVRDGEGATRFIEICVRGARSAAEAKKAARAMAESFLVKTAFFGGDPNWGRLMAAMGKSGIKMREDKVDISFNGVPVVKNGLDTGNESKAARAIKVREVTVVVDLNDGKSSGRVWTTDLSYEYVKINSAYRT